MLPPSHYQINGIDVARDPPMVEYFHVLFDRHGGRRVPRQVALHRACEALKSWGLA